MVGSKSLSKKKRQKKNQMDNYVSFGQELDKILRGPDWIFKEKLKGVLLCEEALKEWDGQPVMKDIALYRLFHCYRYGLGVSQDFKKAEDVISRVNSTCLKSFLRHKLLFDPEDCRTPPEQKVLVKCRDFLSLARVFPDIYYYVFRAQEENQKLYDKKSVPDWELIKTGASKNDPHCRYRLISQEFPESKGSMEAMIKLATDTENILAAWQLASHYYWSGDKKRSKKWSEFVLRRLWPTAHGDFIKQLITKY